jgi:hypothetical protein
MTLKGSEPIQEEQRLKVFIYGPPGSGKTLAALQFKNSYIIDTSKETSRYWKLIKENNSVVFNCSDPYEIMEEIKKLINEPHGFKTLIIDEATTLYQNIQASWTDRFIAAAETKKNKENLLDDFGMRYWDKVKRDWRRLIDLIRNVDMNVIVNAHQKDKYGSNQNIIGITSDSEKNDEYVFDFVFRLIVRGKEYKAITEKQRILPEELDPEAKRFPKEFEWNYPNLLKFYNKEYIEKPTKNSLLKIKETINLPKQDERIKENKSIVPEKNKEEKDISVKIDFNKPIIPKTTNEKQNKNLNNIDKIKKLLKEENIPIKNFKIFLQDTCKWKNATILSKLSEKEQKSLIENWNKVILQYKKTINNIEDDDKEEKIEEPKEEIATSNKINESEIIYEPKEPIRKDQKEKLLKLLNKEKISIEKFCAGFDLKELDEICQEGAEGILKNFKVMIGAFE